MMIPQEPQNRFAQAATFHAVGEAQLMNARWD